MASSRRPKGIIGFTFVVLLAVASLTYTFLAGNQPLLGLDLQGGVSVVLKPKAAADEAQLEQAISIIRQRVDAIGVAEPEITRQQDNVLIQIPGVDAGAQQRAIDLVGQTAELRFRPVLSTCPPEATPVVADPSATTVPPPPADASTTVAPSTTAPASVPPAGEAPPTSEAGLGAGIPLGESAAGAQTPAPTVPTDPSVPTASVPTESVPTPSVPADPSADTPPVEITPGATPGATPGTAGLDPSALGAAGAGQCTAATPTTPRDQDDPTKVVVLPDINGEVRYQLGPSQAKGEVLEDASAGFGGSSGTEWVVRPKFKAGAEGIDQFNAAARQCNPPSATCPTGQLGMTLDGQVISAPTIQTANFSADQVEISGTFTEDSARELATRLKYGALPVELVQQQVQKVSPTLGLDALHAGLVSGLVGLIAVTLYIVAFYRLLGVLAMVKLAVESAILWSFISYLGADQGLALTLAGVTGIIVSIGVSLDSNVVYYENLKEDIRNGRSVRSAGDRAFSTSFSTILKADGVSVLGAGLLYVLSVGPVRGFAFYLMLSTALDLFTSYFFMRPVVSWTTKSKACERHPRAFGLPVGPDPKATEVAGGIVDLPERPSGKGPDRKVTTGARS